MGMTNYLERFIPNLATEMHPMSDLLKSDSVWTWGPPQQKAFDKVKKIISSSTVLAFYEPKKPTVVCADASSEKGCLATVWTCERLSRYLVGLPTFKLLTDHRPLVPLINHRDLDKTPLRCQRLLMHLMRFNSQAEHVPGKQMLVADTLPRSPVKQEQEPDTIEDVLAYVSLIESTRPATDTQMRKIREATAYSSKRR